MISCSSSTASSTPATSRNVIFGESTLMRLARDLPNDITFEPPPWTWFIRKIQNPMKIRIGKTYVSRLRITLERAGLTSQPLSLPSASAFCRRCCSIAAESPWTQPTVYRFLSVPLSVTSAELSFVRRTTLSI